MVDWSIGPDYYQIGPSRVWGGKLAGTAMLRAVHEPEFHVATAGIGSYLPLAGPGSAQDHNPADLRFSKTSAATFSDLHDFFPPDLARVTCHSYDLPPRPPGLQQPAP